jgi:hypothetical protein
MQGKILRFLTSKRTRGFLALLGYSVSLAANFLTSGHLFIGLGIVAVAVVFNVFLFWREISLLRIVYPRTTGAIESPLWLYIFGLIGLVAISLSGYRIVRETWYGPRSLSVEDFAGPYVQGKFIRITDFADKRNIIQGRTFVDSYIYGPAVLYSKERFDLYDTFFDGGPTQNFQIIQDGIAGPATGIITLIDVKFERCHFYDVTFVGTPHDVDNYRKSLKISPK